MAITPWIHYADLPVAPICRSRPGSNMPVGDSWSVQRPTGQARQRDEAGINTWKEKRWPAVKKLRDKAE
jgi:hypothetical protein